MASDKFEELQIKQNILQAFIEVKEGAERVVDKVTPRCRTTVTAQLGSLPSPLLLPETRPQSRRPARIRAPNPGTQSPLPHPERPQSRRPARILTAPKQPAIGAPSSPRRVPNPGAAPPPSRRVSASRRRPSRRPGEVLNGRLPSAPLPRRAAASVQCN